jgi:hypothetical protein
VGETFFTVDSGPDGDWFAPTEHARGPWDARACHAGPPTGLLARAVETAAPGHRLTRLTVELIRPVPLAGFRISATVVRSGRVVASTRAELVDQNATVCAYAHGTHVVSSSEPVLRQSFGPDDESPPRLADATPGTFPITRSAHDLPGFCTDGSVEVAYPVGQDQAPGPTTLWMRTIALLPDETPSPFQRICPLADCGNAFSRYAEPWVTQFLNADLTIYLHRDPVGHWLGSKVTADWHPNGVGISDALLFDEQGTVGRAMQTLVLRRAAAPA